MSLDSADSAGGAGAPPPRTPSLRENTRRALLADHARLTERLDTATAYGSALLGAIARVRHELAAGQPSTRVLAVLRGVDDALNEIERTDHHERTTP